MEQFSRFDNFAARGVDRRICMRLDRNFRHCGARGVLSQSDELFQQRSKPLEATERPQLAIRLRDIQTTSGTGTDGLSQVFTSVVIKVRGTCRPIRDSRSNRQLPTSRNVRYATDCAHSKAAGQVITSGFAFVPLTCRFLGRHWSGCRTVCGFRVPPFRSKKGNARPDPNRICRD
jgi:hypothetical protein